MLTFKYQYQHNVLKCQLKFMLTFQYHRVDIFNTPSVYEMLSKFDLARVLRNVKKSDWKKSVERRSHIYINSGGYTLV